MAKSKYKRENLYTIILWYKDPAGIMRPAKYRNIACNDQRSWKKAKVFLKQKFPTVQYVNIYGGLTRNYIRREYLID
jgi:hypothetical protein